MAGGIVAVSLRPAVRFALLNANCVNVDPVFAAWTPMVDPMPFADAPVPVAMYT